MNCGRARFQFGRGTEGVVLLVLLLFSAGAEESFPAFPVDISRAANMGFRDEVARDGKGGWCDQGPDNDLRALRPGTIRCTPVDFKILDQDTNNGKSAIVVGKLPSRSYAYSVKVPMKGEPLKSLFLLHASAFGPPGKVIGHILISYGDGSTGEIPVTMGKDIGNWWNPVSLANGAVGWSGTNGSAHIGLYASSFPLRGVPVREIQFRRLGIRGFWMIAAVSASLEPGKITMRDNRHVVRANEQWRRFSWERFVEKDSALDFSFLLDAPAGKYGFAGVKNGHFVFEKNRNPIRFYGPNLCRTACFPSREQADQLAERFARMGYNIIRLHHFDNFLLPKKRQDSVTLDPEQLDRFEYFIAALKRRGIYVTMDLFISRKPARGEFPLLKTDQDYKLAAMLIPEVNQNLKEFSRNLLTHRNPHTGLRLVEEPALLNVSIINENTFYYIISRGSSEGIRTLFRQEFERRHPGGMKGGTPDPELYRKFLAELYAAYYQDMVKYLRSIGLRVALTEQNFIPTPNLTALRENYDYVDVHLYWDHPTFPKKSWSMPMYFHGFSSVSRRLRAPAELGAARLFDRPFAVSEFDFSGPGCYRMQAAPIFGAYAALQDWDSMNRFAYSHALRSMFSAETYSGSFEAANDPVRLLGDRLAAVFFLRRDVMPADECAAVIVSPEVHRNYRPRYPEAAGELSLIYKTGSVLFRGDNTVLPANTKYIYALDPAVTGNSWKGVPVLRNEKNSFTSVVSSTGQIAADFRKNHFRVVTPRSEALLLPEKELLAGKVLRVRNRWNYCVAGAIALDNRPLAGSSRILLLHIADVRREGLTFRGPGILVDEWGKGDLLAQKAVADFELALPPGNWTLHALDFSGRRQGLIPFRYETGRLVFSADTFAAAKPVFAYELIRD